MLLYPNKFHKFSVWDVVHDKATGQLREDVGYRGFSSNAAGQIVIPSPWDLYRPAAPGAVAAGSNHFCLVIEGIEVCPIVAPVTEYWTDIYCRVSTLPIRTHTPIGPTRTFLLRRGMLLTFW